MKKIEDDFKNLKELAQEWFSKAAEDELSAGGILKDKDGAPSTVCFLSQQMAEKYLKGYLTFKNKKFPKIHDLANLLKICEEIDGEFPELNFGSPISPPTLYRYPLSRRLPCIFL